MYSARGSSGGGAAIAAIGVARRPELGVGLADALKRLGVAGDLRLQRRKGLRCVAGAAIQNVRLGLDQTGEDMGGIGLDGAFSRLTHAGEIATILTKSGEQQPDIDRPAVLRQVSPAQRSRFIETPGPAQRAGSLK